MKSLPSLSLYSFFLFLFPFHPNAFSPVYIACVTRKYVRPPHFSPRFWNRATTSRSHYPGSMDYCGLRESTGKSRVARWNMRRCLLLTHHLPKGWVFIVPSKVESRTTQKRRREIDARAIVSRLCIIHFILNLVNITAPKGAGGMFTLSNLRNRDKIPPLFE